MKAITLWQPWASLVAIGAKKIETRSWPTKYRGPLAIHAAAAFPMERFRGVCQEPEIMNTLQEHGVLDWINFPRGAVVAICILIDCEIITPGLVTSLNMQEKAFGDYTLGRYAWILEDIKALPEPVPARGGQRLWEWEVPEGVLI